MKFVFNKAESLSSFSTGQRPVNRMFLSSKPQRGAIKLADKNPSPTREIGFLFPRDDDAPLGLVVDAQSYTGRCPIRINLILMCRQNNPKGVASYSPGLRVSALPWENVEKIAQPQRGCLVMGGRGTMRQPRWGCGLCVAATQGSADTRNPGLEDETPLGFIIAIKSIKNVFFTKPKLS